MFTPVATKPHFLSPHLTEGLCQHCLLLRNHLGLAVPLAPMYFHPGVLLTGSEMRRRERSGESYLLPSAGMTPWVVNLTRVRFHFSFWWGAKFEGTWGGENGSPLPGTQLSLTRPFTLKSSSLLWPTHWSWKKVLRVLPGSILRRKKKKTTISWHLRLWFPNTGRLSFLLYLLKLADWWRFPVGSTEGHLQPATRREMNPACRPVN